MNTRRTSKLNPLFLSLWVILSFVGEVHAQGDCGVVNSINYPVDRSTFQLVQDFGVPSPRHQGRYHTGEDYYGGRTTSAGQPVSAIADGRVTYSAPTGWGRDGGVVILEHTFPDGTVAYSMYGHMMNTDVHPFPARFTCVRAGDVVGAVGDVRPAPHLHLEIRTNNPDTPGAGYSPEIPTQIGYLQPTKFITDWQAWLNPTHRWHLQLPDDTRPTAPPLILSDGSMLILTDDRIRLASVDGRILSRIILPAPAVGLTGFEGRPILIYADGTMQVINLDATLGERWSTRVMLDSAPIIMGDLLVFHTPDDGLVALGADRRTVAWRLANIPPFVQSTVTPNLLGLMTEDHTLITVSPQGQLLSRVALAEPAFMTAAPNGNLWVYAQNGVLELDASGMQTRVIDNLVGDSGSSALTTAPDGTRYFLAGGIDPTLTVSDITGTTIWQLPLADVTGRAQLISRDKMLLLLTTYGDVVALQAASGIVCNHLHMYGDRRAKLWYDMGSDGILRIGLADQIIGLDWQALQGACGG